MKNKKIERIISVYKNLKLQSPDTWTENSVKQNSLKNAIEISAMSINSFNKRHPHQYRIPKKALEAFASELIIKRTQIASARSFDDLMDIVGTCRIHRIGELTKYDTALRIGAYLQLFPEKIYLHRGTREGAEIFIGKTKMRYIFKNELPEPFKSPKVTASEIEDILCIFKKQLKSCI